MKIIGLVASLFFSFISIGQKSYYFSAPLPSIDKKVLTVDEQWFGLYSSNSVTRSYEFNETGIYIISTSISSISRETIRESTTYDVRNNFIFGVIENDSIPCVLEGERYYFGIQNKDLLLGPSSKNVLTRLGSNKYVLNFYENGNYIPELITFERNKMDLEDFNYEAETTVFDTIENQKSIDAEYFDLVILAPNPDEYNRLVLAGIYTSATSFKRVK